LSLSTVSIVVFTQKLINEPIYATD